MQNATNSARPLENEPSAFGASRRNADNGNNYVDQELTGVHGESNAPVTQERSKSFPDSAVEMGSLMKSKEDESETAPTVRQRLQNPAAWPLAGVCVSFREYLAEFWGTFVLIFMGNGVVAASKVNPTMGGYLGITFGWGMAVTIALYVSLGISGGHINPAVTFANAVWGRFPWRKVPGFFLAQFLGAFVGAACAYGVYGEQLRRILGDEPFGDNGYANVFSTYPMPGNSFGSSIWSEFACTMMLLLGVSGIFDGKNAAARGHEPIAVGMLVFAIGLTMGSVTGYAINPARDFGPRAFSAILFGSVVFTQDSYYFLVPLFVPFIGGTVGVLLYLFFMPEAKKAAVKDAESK